MEQVSQYCEIQKGVEIFDKTKPTCLVTDETGAKRVFDSGRFRNIATAY